MIDAKNVAVDVATGEKEIGEDSAQTSSSMLLRALQATLEQMRDVKIRFGPPSVCTRNGPKPLLRAYCYTAAAKWLDVVEVSQHTSKNGNDEESGTGGQDNGVASLQLSSVSTGFFPASLPLAPLLSCAMGFLPFFDHGANLLRLRAIHNNLQNDLGTSVQLKVDEEGGVVNATALTVVLTVTLLTVCMTVWNVDWDDNQELALALTILGVMLSLHSVVTLANALVSWRRRKAQNEIGGASFLLEDSSDEAKVY